MVKGWQLDDCVEDESCRSTTGRGLTRGFFTTFISRGSREIERVAEQGIAPSRLLRSRRANHGQHEPGRADPVPTGFGIAARRRPPSEGGIAVATAPPKARFHARMRSWIRMRSKAKAVVIRTPSGHRVVAMIEIVSPGNKSSQTDAGGIRLQSRTGAAGRNPPLDRRLVPADASCTRWIHRRSGARREGDFALPDDKPLTCVSYVGYPGVEVFLEPVAVGDKLPKMPLFLSRKCMSPFPSKRRTVRPGRRCPHSGKRACRAKPPGNGRGKSRRTRG